MPAKIVYSQVKQLYKKKIILTVQHKLGRFAATKPVPHPLISVSEEAPA